MLRIDNTTLGILLLALPVLLTVLELSLFNFGTFEWWRRGDDSADGDQSMLLTTGDVSTEEEGEWVACDFEEAVGGMEFRGRDDDAPLIDFGDGALSLGSEHLPPHSHTLLPPSSGGEAAKWSAERFDTSHTHTLTFELQEAGAHRHLQSGTFTEVVRGWAPHSHDFECGVSEESHSHPVQQQVLTPTVRHDPASGENGVWSQNFRRREELQDDETGEWRMPVLVDTELISGMRSCPGWTSAAKLRHVHAPTNLTRLHPYKHKRLRSFSAAQGAYVDIGEEETGLYFGHAHAPGACRTTVEAYKDAHVHTLSGVTGESPALQACGSHVHTDVRIEQQQTIVATAATTAAPHERATARVLCWRRRKKEEASNGASE